MSRIILISAVNECTIDHHLVYFSWVDRMELPRPQPMILPQGQDAKATLPTGVTPHFTPPRPVR